MGSIVEAVLSHIFPLPTRCELCHIKLQEGESCFCTSCIKKMKRVYEPTCPNCGRPMGSLTYCNQCRGQEFFFSAVRSWGIYKDELREAIHLFKFAKKPYLGKALATLIITSNTLAAINPDTLIVPVPLHPSRLLKRTFNQAQVIAEELAKASEIKWSDVLARVHNTPPQTSYNKEERKKAIQGAFTVKRRQRKLVQGQTILLVDDVFTTGSTVNECSRVLLDAGAREVQVLTIATVLKE